jgi:hexosaminidase
VRLTANTPEGLFRGSQTILQLLQPTKTLFKNWFLPTGVILDEPQFAYRGTMLDLSRHFFGIEYIKEYISYLAYYKINYFHLHLSDDQGWRIEIKSWPKLTEIGGSTDVGGGPGGFYTQEDFKEIVDFAAAHYITIVPEIDMPGHTNAAVVSYPFLNGNGIPPTLYTGKEVGFSTFDTRKDSVYEFIDDVIREIAAISPGEYFHIGGDESHVTEHDDYIYFVNRVEEIVRKYDKRMIGWEEIVSADLDSSSVAQIWRNPDRITEATDKNVSMIMSLANRMYLDMKYDSLTPFGYDWAGLISVEHGYNWSPESAVPTDHLLGIEAPLWSENFSTPDSLEYLAFPRLIGYAELGWSIQERCNWEDYRTRLGRQAAYLNRNSINFYRSPVIKWK